MATRVDDAVTEARAAVARLGEAVRDACAEAVDGLPPVWLVSVTSAGVSVALQAVSGGYAVVLKRPDDDGWAAAGAGSVWAVTPEAQHQTPADALLALRSEMGDRWPWGRE